MSKPDRSDVKMNLPWQGTVVSDDEVIKRLYAASKLVRDQDDRDFGTSVYIDGRGVTDVWEDGTVVHRLPAGEGVMIENRPISEVFNIDPRETW